MSQAEKAALFSSLHVKSNPVILYNIWDPGSASIVEAAGARALATGSWPVAVAHGFADGQNIPLDMMTDNVARIVASTDLPVSADIEGGYGVDPNTVAQTASRIVQAGAVGFNFEDQIVGEAGLHDARLQAQRISAARVAVDQISAGIFINARTDLFLKAGPEDHTNEMLDDAIARAKAYGDAGASGFFAPGLVDEDMIAKLCADCLLPVNIIALPHAPATSRLAALGVARVSYGPVPYKKMTAWLEAQARAAFEY
jgi:2-methylisocitrate lyase-like PEP mutase family enzyme